MKRDLYEEVSARIVEELERGAAPWVKPWSATAGMNTPCNAVTNRPYSGCNVVLLWIAKAAGYRVPRFLTYKQALELGGHVRKGERGTKVYFVKQLQVRDPPIICAGLRCATNLRSRRDPGNATMARYENRAHHDLARFKRLNASFIRRHLTKSIKRDERGFYYSNADNPPARFYFKTWREAAADLAIEIGVTDVERASVS